MIYIQKFSRNPYNQTPPKITSTCGYIYGICARQLYYNVKYNKVGYTKKTLESFGYGTKKHHEVEKTIFPNMEHELHIERNVNTVFGIERIGATLDCIDDKKVIEIKPYYSRMAYVQTLIEKYVCPDHDFFIYDYHKERLFPIKANLDMAIVYIGRIITAMNRLPPKIPNANYSKEPCKSCIFRKECYETNDKETWETWKRHTTIPIRILQNTTSNQYL